MYAIELNGLDEARAIFGEKVASAAVRSTINKTATRASTVVNRAIRDTYDIKARDLKKRGKSNRNGIEVKRAKVGETEALILGFGRELPLINFAVTPNTPEKDRQRKRRKGVRVRVKKEGGKKRLRHVFVQRMKTGHIGLFEREADNDGRFPIRQLFGPSVPSMLKGKVDVIEQTVADLGPNIFEHELQFYVARAAGKR